MKRLVEFVGGVALLALVSAHTYANCKPQQSYEVVFADSGPVATTGTRLKNTDGDDLDCWMAKPKTKDEPTLCEKASGISKVFLIKVHNRCRSSLQVGISVLSKAKPSTPPRSDIKFLPGSTCELAGSAPIVEQLPPGRPLQITCETIAYNPTMGADVAGEYTVTATHYRSRWLGLLWHDVANGTFDPEIVIERDGSQTPGSLKEGKAAAPRRP